MNFHFIVPFVLCVSLFWSHSLLAAPWNKRNDPANFGANLEYRLSQLPNEGKVKSLPWAGYSWKSRKGGLAYRWQSQEPAWNFSPLTSLVGVSNAVVKSISPAEKFDLWTGSLDLPLFRDELRRNRPNDISWGGLCHGWAAASTLFLEPKLVTLPDSNGVMVSFGSADIKALLSLVVGEVLTKTRSSLGERCLGGDSSQSPECLDVNAGSFHVALANMVGLKGRSVIGELSVDQEIWNKPVVNYKSRLVATRGFSQGAAPGTVEETEIETTVTFVTGSDPTWEADGDKRKLVTYVYRYVVEKDGSGKIVGGK
jgi:Transglutaminase elicitor